MAFESTAPSAPIPPPRRMRAAKSRGALVPWLAARILEHLQALGLQPGEHITEQRLADHCQVSRSPVRQALALLAGTRAVEYRPNRGYFVAEPATAVSGAEIAAPESDDKLYYRIAEDRLAGRIPQRVTEMDLVRRYRTRRARIAALLARMAQEGWVERLPGHGWAFQPMLDSVKGYEQAFRFRAALEPAALREPGYHLPREAIERCRRQQRALLDGAFTRFSHAEIFEIGAAMHETIVAGSGNPFFIDAMRRVNSLRRLLEYRAKRSRETLAQQCTEHLKLLDLIEAGKTARAADFLEAHLDVARKAKAKLVKPAPARFKPGAAK